MKINTLLYTFFLSFIIFSFKVEGQTGTATAPVHYELIYNTTTCLYEAHAHVQSGILNFPFNIPFPSNFTIVIPESLPDVPIATVSYQPPSLSWTNSNNIYSPVSDTIHDFHMFSISGGGAGQAYTTFQAGDDILLFTFSIPHSSCEEGIRIFINGMDPNSGAPGMNGLDLSNSLKTFDASGTFPQGIEQYEANINNSGIILPKPDPTPTFDCMGDTLILAANVDTSSYPSCLGPLTYSWSGQNNYTSTEENPVIIITDPEIQGGYYYVTVTDSNGCSSLDSIDVNALAIVTLTDPVDACIDGADMNFTASPAGGTFTTDAPAGFTPNNGAGTAVLDISVAGAGTYNVTYDYTNANGCSHSQTVSVTVNPLPIVDLNDPSDVCIDGADMNFTASPAAGIFSTTATAGFTPNNGAGTAVLDVSAAGAGTYDVTYEYTDSNGCSDSTTVSVTVNALPVVTLNDPSDVCIDGSDMNFTASPAGGTFSTTATTGFTPNNGAGTAVLDVSAAGAGTYEVSYEYTDVNGCTNSETVSVTINALPIVTLADPVDVCIDGADMNFTASPAGGTFSTTATSGFTPNNGAGTAVLDVSAAGAGTYDVTYDYTDANGCSNDSTVSVTVNPLPVVDAGTYGPLCVDASAITLTGSPTGGTFSGPGVSGGSFDPATAGAGTHTITYEYTDANGCTNSATTDIVVNSLPVVDAGTYGPYCVDALAITIVGSPTGGTFSGTGVSGSMFDPATAGSGTHTITYTYTDANGCTNNATTDIVINPLPVITLNDPSDECIDGADMNFTATPVGGAFSTTATAGFTANNAAGTAVLDVSVAGAGTYDVSYSYIDANGCTNDSTVSVTVNALPTITLNEPADECIDGADMNFTATPAGGTFSTTATAGFTANNAAGTAVLDVSAAGAGTYDVSYSYTNANGCANDSIVSVTINPLPVVDAGTYGPLCVDEMSITLEGTPKGGLFSGTGVNANMFNSTVAGEGLHTITYEYYDANGCSNSGTTEIIVNGLPIVDAGTYGDLCFDSDPIALEGNPVGGIFSGTGVSGNFFDPDVSGTGDFLILYEYTDTNGCYNSDTTTIKVNPLPIVESGNYGPYCIDVSSVTLSGNPTGGIFSGPGVSGNIFEPGTAGAGSHEIVYTYADPTTNCEDTSSTIIVVNDLPILDAGSYPDLCVSDDPISLVGTPPGGSFSGSGVMGNMFDPSSGQGNYSITYEYEDENGCYTSDVTNITVNPLPVVNAGTYGPYCVDASPITLTGSPTGGTFSGTGVSGNMFDPTTAGSNTHIITYEYTDANGCMNSATTNIVINPLPVVDAGTYGPYCVDTSPITLTGSPTGGSFSGTGVSGSMFDPATAGSGIHTITYTYTDTNGCTNSVTTDILVNPLPLVDAGTYGPFCVDDSTITLAGSPTSGTFSGTGVSGNMFAPATSGLGTHTITYEYTDANGCTNSATTDIVVNPLPTITLNDPADECIDGMDMNFMSTPAGGTFSTTATAGFTANNAVGTAVLDVSAAGAGTYDVSYSYTDANGCMNDSTVSVTVNPLPTITLNDPADECIDGMDMNFMATPAGGTFSTTATAGFTANNAVGTAVLDVSAAGVGTYDVSYIYTDANGCTNDSTVSVTVNPLLTITLNDPADECIDGMDMNFMATPAGGTFSTTATAGFTANNAAGTAVLDVSAAGAGTYDVSYSYTDANGCMNDSTVSVTVNPFPTITLNDPADECIDGMDMNFMATPAGGTFSTTATAGFTANNAAGTAVLDVSAAGAGTYDVSYSYTDANGCTNDSTVSVTVNPLPTITLNNPADECIDGMDMNFMATPAGGTFSTTATAGFTSNNAAGTAVLDVSAAGAGTYDVSYSYTDANGCTNDSTVSVTVNPFPTITLNDPTDECIDGMDMNFMATPAGGTFSTTATAGFTANNAAGTAVLDVSAAGVGTYDVSYSYTDANGCVNDSTVSVTVNPFPTITLNDPADECIDGADMNFTAIPVGGAFSTTATAGFTANNAAGTAVLDVSVAGAGTYDVSYSYTDANGCMNDSTVSVTVNPFPTITLNDPADECIDGMDMNFMATPAGGTFSTTATAGFTANNAAGTAVLDVSAAGAGTYDVSYSYTDTNGCMNDSTVSVTVNPLPTITLNNPADECIDGMDMNFMATPSGGTFSTTATAGFTANNAAGTAVLDVSAAGAGTYDVSYSYTDTNGCMNDSTVSVTVNPLPTITLNDPADECIDGMDMNFMATPSGGTFSTTATAGFTSNNAAGTAVLDVSAAGAGTYDVSYSYTDTNGCMNDSTVSVTVNPFPTITLNDPTDECIDGMDMNFMATPAGGTFSTTATAGFTSNNAVGTAVLDVSAAGVGTYDVSYSYTDANGCMNDSTVSVTVNPLPTITLNDPADECIDGMDMNFMATPSGGTFSTTATAGFTANNAAGTAVLDVSAAGAGTYDVSYSYTDTNGCMNDSTVSVTVNPLPTITLNNPADECIDGMDMNFMATPSGGTFSTTATAGFTANNAAGTAVLDVSAAGAGTYDVSYSYTDTNGCMNDSTVSVTVNPFPTITLNDPADECIDGMDMNFMATPAGGTFSTTATAGFTSNNAVGTAVLDVSAAGVGTYDVSYSYTDANGCTNDSTVSVTVNPFPTITLNDPADECIDGMDMNFMATPAGGTFSTTATAGFTSNNAAGTAVLDVSAAGAGTYDVSYSYTDTNGCMNDSTVSVTVNPFPTITLNDPTDECIDGMDMNFMATPAGGTFSTTATAGFTSNNAVGTAVLDVSAAGVGTYDVSYSYTDANGCVNDSTVSVTVNSLPVVDAGTYGGPYCVDSSPITLTGSPTGGIFSGTGVSGSMFEPATAGEGTHTITYTYTNANGCTNSATTDIVVNPLPVVDAGAYGPYCVDASAITLAGSPSGGTFSGTGVSGNMFDPVVAGDGEHKIYYTYTDPVTFCQSTDSTLITVNDLPIVSISDDQSTTCQSGVNIQFVGSPTPDGITTFGSFQSTVVMGLIDNNDGTATLNVDGLDPGFYFVTYDFIDANGCINSATTEIQICVFDLALTKTLGVPTDNPLVPGSTVTFDIVVTNEGDLDATQVQVGDNIPLGLELADVNWVENSGVATLVTPIASILSGASETVNITFTIAGDYMGDQITNVAEVVSAKDTEGNDQDDEDSTPDNEDGSPYEDDEDDETIDIAQTFDLALIKTVGIPTDSPLEPGGTVTFDISVINQGTLNGYNVQISDYVPTGLTLADVAWVMIGDTARLVTPIDTVSIGETATVSITFTVDDDYEGGTIANNAEIESVEDSLGNEQLDGDSEAGNEDGTVQDPNDDDVVLTDGSDDYDGAQIVVLPIMSIGSTVWEDINDNGTFDESIESGVEGIVVNLYLDADMNGVPDGPSIGSTPTDEFGDYFFGGLSPGDYIVGIMPTLGLAVSSTTTTTTDDSMDNDDNGIQGAAGTEILSPSINLTQNGEPENETGQGGAQDEPNDNDGDMTVDFGLVPYVSIGSTVFGDANKDGWFNEPIEEGLNGVVVNLYADTDMNGVPDGPPIGSTITDEFGDYFFGGLLPGDYIIGVLPLDSLPLSSPVGVTNTVDDGMDNDDNGIQTVGGAEIFSPSINLTGGDEPTIGETGQGGTQDDANGQDSNGDMTIDFGMYGTFDLAIQKTIGAPTDNPLVPGSTVTFDIVVTNEGDLDATQVQVGDNIPLGLELADVNWVENSGVATLVTPIASILSGASETVSITFTIAGDYMGDQITNVAEVVSAKDTEGNDGIDEDSTPDNEDGSPFEDDEDDETIDVTQTFDLALIKTIGIPTDSPLEPGGTVTFDISVINQGTLNGYNVQISDYVPTGLTLADVAWVMIGDTARLVTPIDTVSIGETATVSITFTVDDDYEGGTIANNAEIESVEDSLGNEQLDGDSEAGNEDGTVQDPNDDDVVLTDGSDDYDGAQIVVLPIMSIGSTVWEDINDNGTFDESIESGVEGIVVNLYLDADMNGVPDGPSIGSTTTDEFGDYFFGGLSPGDYIVGIMPTLGLAVSSTTTTTTDDSMDNDDNGIQGAAGTEILSPSINLTQNGEPENETGQGGAQDEPNDNDGDMTVDFGLVPYVSIGSTVFGDANKDGWFNEPIEEGLNGVVVNLYADTDMNGVPDGPPIGSTITDEFGDYFFGGLLPGDYIIGVLPLDSLPLSSPVGVTNTVDDGMDNDDNGIQTVGGAEIFSPSINLTGGDEPTIGETGQGGTQDDANGQDSNGDMTIDFGMYGTFDLAIQKTIGAPTDNPLVPGSTVTFDIVVTNEGDLDATQVQVGDNIPLGLELADVNWVENSGVATLVTPIASILSGASETVSITLTIAGDFMGDQITNVAEVVSAKDTEGNDGIDEDSTPDNEDGSPYEDDEDDETIDIAQTFDLALIKTIGIPTDSPLKPGGTVTFDISVINQGTLNGYNVQISDYVPTGLTLADAAWVMIGDTARLVTPIDTVSIGETATVSITFTVDDDYEGGTIANNAEIESVKDSLGNEQLDGDSEAGNEDGTVQDPNDDDVVLTDGSDDYDGAQIVVLPIMSIGSTVWEDINNNGTFDESIESGVEGIVVNLYLDADMNGVPDGPSIGSTSTDEFGDYFFGGLSPGDYIIGITPTPELAVSSTTTNTTDDSMDNDDNGIQGAVGTEILSPSINLTQNGEPENETGQGGAQDEPNDNDGDMTVDFGLVPYVSIGSTVFGDANQDGWYNEPTEDGLEGVTVNLYADDDMNGIPDGPSIGSTTTDAFGDYIFDGLLPGDYVIGLLPLDSLPLSSPALVTNTADDQTDNDDNGIQGASGLEILSPSINLTGGQEPTTEESGQGGTQDDANGQDSNGDMTIDFGMYGTFDLAIQKTIGAPTDNPLVPGSTVTFDIEVSNEGDLDAIQVQVGDNIPSGLELADANWVENSGVATLVTPIASILSGTSETVSITFTIAGDYMGDQITNVAEVVSAKDTEGNDGIDEDSTPDNEDGSPYEDDEDDETIDVTQTFDLALIKILGEPTDSPIRPGSIVTFDLIVFNQGTLDAYTVQLNDYIPEGLILDDSDWDETNQIANLINEIPFIAAGTSDTISITFTVDPDFSGTGIINNAEINSAYDILGNLGQDEDSNPGNDGNNPPDPNDNNIDDSNGGDDFDPSLITIIPNADIGDFVWIDSNANGIQDNGEVGIQGVIVYALDINGNIVGVDTSDINGYYLIEDLIPGDYQLQFDLTDLTGEWEISPQDIEPTDNSDSDADQDGLTIFTTLDPAELDDSWDLGIYQTAELGDLVWFDLNEDGIYDDGEVPAEGIEVMLYSGDGTSLGSAFTDEDGLYLFYGLIPGDYYIGFDPGTEYQISPLDVNNDDTVDSDIDPNTLVSETTTLTSGESDLRWDIGIYVESEYEISDPCSCYFREYEEDDVIKFQDRINVTGTPGSVFTVVSQSGMFEIDPVEDNPIAIGTELQEIMPGIYILDFLHNDREGYIVEVSNGINNLMISSSCEAYDLFMTPMNIEVCIYDEPILLTATASINGLDVPGTTLFVIRDQNGAETEITEFDPTGYMAGDVVNIIGAFTPDDSSICPRTNTYLTVLVGDCFATVGDEVFKDLNGDGINGIDEPGVEGVIVRLEDCSGMELASMTTGPDGSYQFEDVIPGDYQISFDISNLPVGCDFTIPNATDEANDSDVNSSGVITCFTLAPDEVNLDLDAGLVPLTVNIGDFVWHDINGNGIQEGGEPGIADVLILLYDEDNNLVGVTDTDINGNYEFVDLYPNTYYLVFTDPEGYTLSDPNQGVDDELDSDVTNFVFTGEGSTTDLFSLVPGQDDDYSFDAGYYVCVPIGESVWYDVDEDDIFDSNENGINGLVVNLYKLVNGSYVLYDATSTGHKPGTPSDDGYFKFCSPPGTYYIEVVMPPIGLVQTIPNVFNNLPIGNSSESNKDSDLTNNFGQGTTEAFSVTSGDQISNIGAGFYPMATIGNLVWLDENLNGLQEENEQKVSGVLVEAYNTDGEKISESTTNNAGVYNIDYLQKQDYYLKFSPPEGYGFIEADAGDDDIDSDVNHSNGYNTTDFISMQPGLELKSVDAGIQFGALPVVWLSIAAEWKGDFNEVRWTTASETNNDFYEVERRHESESEFVYIGQVDAKGFNSSVQNYNYSDFEIDRSGKYYYRIKQMDLDGKFNYSKIVFTSIKNESNIVDLYPNPSVGYSKLIIDLSSNSEVEIKIINAEGKLIKSILVPESNGERLFREIEVAGLPLGVYMIHIAQNDFKAVKKLIVVK